MQKHQKKNKKLLVQIGLTVLPVLMILILGITLVTYKAVIESFLDGENAHVSTFLNNIKGVAECGYSNPELMEYYLDRWEADPDALLVDPNEEETSKFLDSFFKYLDSEDEQSELEWIRSLPEEQQKVDYQLRYHDFADVIKSNSKDAQALNCFMLDARDPQHLVTLYDSITEDGEQMRTFDLKNGTETHKLFESDELCYELRVNDGVTYTGYLPLYIDGKLYLIIGLSYDWTQFNTMLLNTLTNEMKLSFAIIMLTELIILISIYFRAVRPVQIIHSTVRDYIPSKDSNCAIEKLNKIRVHNELGMLADNIKELALEIDRYTEENIRLAGEREHAAAELELAAGIQDGMLPKDFPAHEQYEMFATMQPAKEVGGDFYDFFPVDDDHLALIIADASGKGVPAALFTMVTKAFLKKNLLDGLSPAQALQETNKAVMDSNSAKMFITVWVGIYEISTGHLTAANAGHEYPIIRQPDGDFTLYKEPHGLVLGFMPDFLYQNYELDIAPGGTLFVYTDGAPEATNASEELFGTDRMLGALNREPDAAPEALVRLMEQAIDEFVGAASQFDDLTMLVIKRCRE